MQTTAPDTTLEEAGSDLKWDRIILIAMLLLSSIFLLLIAAIVHDLSTSAFAEARLCIQHRAAARVCAGKRDYWQAESLLKLSRQEAEKNGNRLLLADTLTDLGQLYAIEGKPEAATTLESAIAIYQEFSKAQKLTVSDSHHEQQSLFNDLWTLARFHSRHGKTEDALPFFERANELSTQLEGASVERSNLLREYASQLRRVGRNQDADFFQAESVADIDPKSCVVAGISAFNQHKFALAETFFQFSLRNAELTKSMPEAGMARILVATCMLPRDPKGSESLCRKSIAECSTMENRLNSASVMAFGYALLAVKAQLTGQDKQAAADLDRALQFNDLAAETEVINCSIEYADTKQLEQLERIDRLASRCAKARDSFFQALIFEQIGINNQILKNKQESKANFRESLAIFERVKGVNSADADRVRKMLKENESAAARP